MALAIASELAERAAHVVAAAAAGPSAGGGGGGRAGLAAVSTGASACDEHAVLAQACVRCAAWGSTDGGILQAVSRTKRSIDVEGSTWQVHKVAFMPVRTARVCTSSPPLSLSVCVCVYEGAVLCS